MVLVEYEVMANLLFQRATEFVVFYNGAFLALFANQLAEADRLAVDLAQFSDPVLLALPCTKAWASNLE
ncbi:hypothetical protein B5K06_25965 [Rhizobium grahamii]|uniref:Uncharacterized protein n=1 Tax=Rhizobium grahamii TaxID=1120045 RepID=A0A370KHX9_9HYPH|nr:hypothetical protein B5K06_25965 [Rhizobium grahamii]